MKTYATAAAFRRALEDRLNRASKEEGIDLQRMRRQVAFDRLLARLFAIDRPWRLKGGYALEQKLHAYTMPRQDRPNTRVKDLVDLVLLIEAGGLDEERLRRDIADTFRHRATHAVPATLEEPPDFWGPVFEKLAEECGIGRDIREQFSKVRDFMAALL